jgi:predicted permease
VNHLIFTQVLTLFLVLGVGAAARKARCLSAEAVKGLADLLMVFALPALVFTSCLRPFDPALLASAGRMLGYSVLVLLLMLLIGVLLFRRSRADRRPTLQCISAFSNCGFMGLPLLAAIFPDRGVFFGAVFTVALNAIAFTLGVTLFNPGAARPHLRKLLLSPVLLGTYAGLACFLGSVRPPQAIAGALNLVGGMTAPVSMLIIGATLGEAKLRDLLGGSAEYAVNAVRLLLAPLLTLLVCRLLHADALLTRILVVLEALPAATMVAVFVETYGGDQVFVSRCTFISTALSLATIPLVVTLMEWALA